MDIQTQLLINLYISEQTPTKIVNLIHEKFNSLPKDFIDYLQTQTEEIEINNAIKQEISKLN
jgi:endonuclease III